MSMITWPCVYEEAARAGMGMTVVFPELSDDGIIWHIKPRIDDEPFCGLAPRDYEAGATGEFIVAMRGRK